MNNLNELELVPGEVYEIGADKVPVIPEWSVKDDTTLLQKVKTLAHSTFDSSKFTVVGSPTITSEGIASGFSGNNYLQFSLTTVLTQNNAIKIELGGTYQSVSETKVLLASDGLRLAISSTLISFWSNTDTKLCEITNGLQISDDFKIIVIFDNTNGYQIIGYRNGVLMGSAQNATVVNSFSVQNFNLGIWKTSDVRAFTGSIDLKQFSITVDGVEVFSGNKTGIDTIKADDYTAVGSPTITSDGIVSGFSNSNYLTYNLPPFGAKPFKIIAKINTGTANTSRYILKIGEQNSSSILMISANNNLVFWSLVNDGHNTDISKRYDGVPANTELYVKTEWDGNYYWSSISYDGQVWLDGEKAESTYELITSEQSGLTIGHVLISNFNLATGSIDLNSFKIYVDGDLVYQPCLKIPYTEGVNNNKIVDSIYRDRVKDLFEQVGYNGYYTIDEENETFTLPTHKFSDVIDMYENGINKWEQRVDRTLKQQGSCTSGTEVTLLKPYADTNYALSVPYSAKSATAFTPTVTGDWFAEGKVVL